MNHSYVIKDLKHTRCELRKREKYVKKQIDQINDAIVTLRRAETQEKYKWAAVKEANRKKREDKKEQVKRYVSIGQIKREKLVKAGKELNTLLGVDPPIPLNVKKINIVEKIYEAIQLIDPDDTFTKTTKGIIQFIKTMNENAFNKTDVKLNAFKKTTVIQQRPNSAHRINWGYSLLLAVQEQSKPISAEQMFHYLYKHEFFTNEQKVTLRKKELQKRIGCALHNLFSGRKIRRTTQEKLRISPGQHKIIYMYYI